MRFFAVAPVFLAIACSTSPVDESYGTSGRGSINGLDVMQALLSEFGEVTNYSYLPENAGERADLLVHFENFFRDEDYYTLLEDRLRHIRDEGKLPPIVYFLRDTDASLSFWRRIEGGMPEGSQERAFAASHAEARLNMRRNFPADGAIPFGRREILHKEGRFVGVLFYDEEAFPSGVPFLPVHSVPGEVESGLDDEHHGELEHRALLRGAEGDVLIREFFLERGRFILVYNAEPFLNHSLGDPKNMDFARDLVRFALGGAEEARILVIRNSFVPAREAAEEEDRLGMLRVFLVFPVNLIVLQFVGALAVFLLWRYAHDRPPLDSPPPGNREFLEHIRALGRMLHKAPDSERKQEGVADYGRNA